MNNKTKTLLGLIAFAILIVGAYFAYNSLSSRFSKQNAQALETAKESRTKAPDFTVVNGRDKSVKLSEFLGKPVVVNFWASWCPPCRGEMPHFDKVYADYKDKVNFMMIDLTDGQRETVKSAQDYIDSQGYSFPVYFDTKQEGAFAYMIQSIPTTIFIDSDGYVVEKVSGAMEEDELRGYLENLK